MIRHQFNHGMRIPKFQSQYRVPEIVPVYNQLGVTKPADNLRNAQCWNGRRILHVEELVQYPDACRLADRGK